MCMNRKYMLESYTIYMYTYSILNAYMSVRPKTAPSLCNNVTSTSVHGRDALDSLGTDLLEDDALGTDALGSGVPFDDTFDIGMLEDDVLEVRLLCLLGTVDIWRDDVSI